MDPEMKRQGERAEEPERLLLAARDEGELYGSLVLLDAVLRHGEVMRRRESREKRIRSSDEGFETRCA
jgi:hypothetical protein